MAPEECEFDTGTSLSGGYVEARAGAISTGQAPFRRDAREAAGGGPLPAFPFIRGLRVLDMALGVLGGAFVAVTATGPAR
jgi:hypothetical protein